MIKSIPVYAIPGMCKYVGFVDFSVGWLKATTTGKREETRKASRAKKKEQKTTGKTT